MFYNVYDFRARNRLGNVTAHLDRELHVNKRDKRENKTKWSARSFKRVRADYGNTISEICLHILDVLWLRSIASNRRQASIIVSKQWPPRWTDAIVINFVFKYEC